MKKLIMAMLIIIMVFTVCACSSRLTPADQDTQNPEESSKPAEVPENTSSTEKPKIDFWYFGDEFTTEHFNNLLTPVKDEVDVKLVLIPNAQYENKLRIATNSGNAPDVFMVDGVYTANYASVGILAPLDDYWPDEDFKDYVQSSQEKCSYQGQKYAVSQQESSCVLFYNKDLFETAGITDIADSIDNAWTYDRLIEAAQQLTIRDDSGQTIQYGLQPSMSTPDVNNEGQTFIYTNMIWNLGGEVTDPDVTTASGYMDSEKTIAAIQLYADLFNKYNVSSLQTIEQGFQTGKVAMLIHNISMIGGLESSFPDLNFGVMPLPKGENQYGTSGGWNYGMSTQCEQPEAGWKVLDALSGKEGHLIHCQTNGAMPSRLSTIELMPNLVEDNRLKIASDLIKIARPRPITPAYFEISPLISDAFNAAAFGEDPAVVAKTAAEKIDKILAKYN